MEERNKYWETKKKVLRNNFKLVKYYIWIIFKREWKTIFFLTLIGVFWTAVIANVKFNFVISNLLDIIGGGIRGNVNEWEEGNKKSEAYRIGQRKRLEEKDNKNLLEELIQQKTQRSKDWVNKYFGEISSDPVKDPDSILIFDNNNLIKEIKELVNNELSSRINLLISDCNKENKSSEEQRKILENFKKNRPNFFQKIATSIHLRKNFGEGFRGKKKGRNFFDINPDIAETISRSEGILGTMFAKAAGLEKIPYRNKSPYSIYYDGGPSYSGQGRVDFGDLLRETDTINIFGEQIIPGGFDFGDHLHSSYENDLNNEKEGFTWRTIGLASINSITSINILLVNMIFSSAIYFLFFKTVEQGDDLMIMTLSKGIRRFDILMSKIITLIIFTGILSFLSTLLPFFINGFWWNFQFKKKEILITFFYFLFLAPINLIWLFLSSVLTRKIPVIKNIVGPNSLYIYNNYGGGFIQNKIINWFFIKRGSEGIIFFFLTKPIEIITIPLGLIVIYFYNEEYKKKELSNNRVITEGMS